MGIAGVPELDTVEGGEKAAQPCWGRGTGQPADTGPGGSSVADGVVRETEGGSGEYVEDDVEIVEGGGEVGPEAT